jgi:hypothetical protein
LLLRLQQSLLLLPLGAEQGTSLLFLERSLVSLHATVTTGTAALRQRRLLLLLLLQRGCVLHCPSQVLCLLKLELLLLWQQPALPETEARHPLVVLRVAD